MKNVELRPGIPRYAVTTDSVVIGFNQAELFVVLIRRKNPPFEGMWALPGGFVEENEDLEEAALRELKEETRLELDRMVQVGAFGKPGRDPRGRVISIAYLALRPLEELKVDAGDDAKEAGLFSLNRLPPLAFDHQAVIAEGCKKLLWLWDQRKASPFPFLEEKIVKVLKERLGEFLEQPS